MSCWQWASLFGETNICDARDKAGFLIGLASIICWGLAEVPQLVANAAEGSSEGISEGLLWLWVFSDVLDVAGCSFADTLPTMVITAWMYLIFTVALLLQHIYYTRIRLPSAAASDGKPNNDVEAAAPLLWSQHSASSSGSADEPDLVAELFGAEPQRRPAHTGSSHTMYGSLRNLSIRRTSSSSSLSLSDTGRRLHDSFSGYQQRRLVRGRRLGARHRLAASSSSPGRPSTADAAAASSSATLRSSLPASCSGPAAAGRMLLGGVALLGLVAYAGGSLGGRGAVGDRPGRLAAGGAAAEQQLWGVSYATWGAAMGWAMAVTFFLGRVPQVVKNWQRKSCAGLSMEMFAIVLTAAATYCASILVRARSWADLLPKLPFLTDAAVGALLDLVILCQFFIYSNADEELAGAPNSASRGSSSSSSSANAQGKASSLPRIMRHAGSFSSSGSSSKSDMKQQQSMHTSDLLASLDAGDASPTVPSAPVPVPMQHSTGVALSLPEPAASESLGAVPCLVGGLQGLVDAPAEVLLLQEAGSQRVSTLGEVEGQACSWADSLISIATI